MVEYLLDEYLEFSFGTQTPATGAAVDADALPTYRVYEEDNDTVVATGNCAKRDDAGTLGYYFARAQITTVAGYEVGKDYYVEGVAIVGGVTSPPVPIGMFRVVPADVARDDQWTDARAALQDNLDAAVSTRAVPGDAMALIADAVDDTSVEDYSKFMADVSALALEASITALKDFDPTSDTVARVTLVDLTTANTDVRGTDGAALASVWTAGIAALIDAAISSRAAPGAQMDLVDVPNAIAVTAIQAGLAQAATALTNVTWTDVMAAFLDAAISSRAVAGDEMDLVDAPNATAIAAIQAELALEMTLTAIKGGAGWTSAESLKAIKDAIDAIGPGEGANVVDVTLNDGAGDPADGVIAVARLVSGTLARGTGTTGAGGTTGEVQFQLDDGTYEVTFGPSATYSFTNPYTLVVSGATIETFVCTLLGMPTPSAPELCVCYADLRYVDGGQLIGADEGYLQVIAVTDDPHVWPPLATQAALAVDDVLYQTDASGRAQFEAVRGAVITVRVVRPWGYGANLHEEQVTFTVPDEAAYWIPGAHS